MPGKQAWLLCLKCKAKDVMCSGPTSILHAAEDEFGPKHKSHEDQLQQVAIANKR